MQERNMFDVKKGFGLVGIGESEHGTSVTPVLFSPLPSKCTDSEKAN